MAAKTGLVPAICLALLAVHCAGDTVDRPRAELTPGELVASGPAASAAGFNLLLITVDTLRADHLGCYGFRAARTPAIDGLTRPGILFENAIAPAPITLPSHSTIMTGQRVTTHGVRNNGTFRLMEESRTLAETLRDHGYSTAAFIGAYVLDSRYGLAQGFDVYDDNVNPRNDPLPKVEFNQREANYISDAAIDWLERAAEADAPFFAWLHYFDPHAPYQAPPSFAGSFPDSPYDAEIAFADSQIARVVELLDRRGLRDRTLVVLTADHGEGLGEHGESTHALLIYDSTVRVPLILSSPGLFPADLVYRAGAVGLTDLLPSILHLLGLPHDSSIDGVNVFAQPPGNDRAVYVESLVPLFQHGWSSLHGLRRAGSKLIRAPEMEFFRLAEDPGERLNVYSETDSEIRALTDELDRLLESTDSPIDNIGRVTAVDAEQQARLAALGYVDLGREPAEVTLADPKAMMPVWNRIRLADNLGDRKRYAEAIKEIEAVLEEHTTSAKAWYTATKIYHRSGDHERARVSVRHAVELDPRSDGFVTLAQLSMIAGDEAEFESALARAAALDPGDGGIYIARGDRLAIAGRYQEARVEFERALEVDPYRSGPTARQKLARLEARLQP